MAWRSFTATGSFTSILGLVLLVSSGCSGDGSALFDSIGGSSGVGASGGNTPNGGGKSNSAGSTGSGAGTSGNSGGAGNQAGTDAGGTDTGGTDTGGTDTGGTDTGGTDTGGTAGSAQGGHAGSMAGMGGSGGKGGAGGSGGGPAACTTALFNGHSYSFCGAVDSGNSAFALCEKLGMVPVSIESKAENDFLVGKLAGSSWIGGSDEGHEGEWHWPSEVVFWDETDDDDGPIEGRYQNWQEGQPNNDNDDGLDENCAVIQMSTSGKGTWNDLACGIDTDFRATCESTGPVIGPIPL